MNTNIAAILQPLNQHFKAVLSELIAKPRCFCIIVTEIRSGVIFALTTSTLISIDFHMQR